MVAFKNREHKAKRDMCGIVGWINFNGENIDRHALIRMRDILVHRGPDHGGIFIDGPTGLAHRRLSIIDLSPAAHQPMSNEDETIWIVINGEIYNYLELRKELESKGYMFNSNSDTEVIIHSYEEWGVDCLQKFIGMWAFAIWDSKKLQLFAARDKLGIKPFYYCFDGTSFMFASEIKALLENTQIDRKIVPQSIYEYLYYGYALGDKTWFYNVKKLLPGHYLLVDKHGLKINKYWDVRIDIDYDRTEEETAFKLRELLEDSVRLCLRSDVPVGAHLSGGVDSSSVVAVASRLCENSIHTFSGAFYEGERYDEREYIKEMVKNYPLNYHEVMVRPDNFLDRMQKIVWHMDEPTAGPGVYPQHFICQLTHDEGIKVILGGQGGDELFGGYPHYLSGIMVNLIRSFKDRNSLYLRKAAPTLSIVYRWLRRYTSVVLELRKRRVNKLLSRDFLKEVDYGSYIMDGDEGMQSADEMMLWDLKNYLPGLLHVEDRMSMAFSVESRLPLLDHRIVELAFTIPLFFKVNSVNSKYILRETNKDILPYKIYSRRDKKGFPTPFSIWTERKAFRDSLREITNDSCKEIFRDDTSVSWEKLNISLWMKLFGVRI